MVIGKKGCLVKLKIKKCLLGNLLGRFSFFFQVYMMVLLFLKMESYKNLGHPRNLSARNLTPLC